MSRFGGRSREGRDGGERGSRREAFRGGRGSGGGGRKSYGGRSRGNDSGFINVGGITPTKNTDPALVKELRRGDIKTSLWWKVYLPEGSDSITLHKGDKILLNLGSFSKEAPSFVVGSAALPPKEEGEERESRGSRRSRNDYED